MDVIRLGSWEFWGWEEDQRDGAFATLRREAPIAFFAETRRSGRPNDAGFWALTRHADVQFASRNPQLFRSAPYTSLAEPHPSIVGYVKSMIHMDDPQHQRLRSIVSRAFTPKVLASADASIRERARSLVAAMVAKHPDGSADFVAEVAAPLPLQVICDMMGVPEADHEAIYDWTNILMGLGDPDITRDLSVFNATAIEMGNYGERLAEDRRAHPREDLTTALVHAEANGQRLTSIEIASFFILLATAGNETTRHATSHGLVALTRSPEQRRLWWSDFDAHRRTAVEEIIRWSSPVNYMRRTLFRDVELGGVRMAAGDKVAMWYISANRDEEKFANPWMFDLRRDPNPHVGFGGGGTHFCLGANLARREISLIFEQLQRQVPDIVAQEPARLRSSFVHGIKQLPVVWTAPTVRPGGE